MLPTDGRVPEVLTGLPLSVIFAMIFLFKIMFFFLNQQT